VTTQNAVDIFGEHICIKLFGSRLDDGLAGGDIDLLIESGQVIDQARRKSLQLVAGLQIKLGDQPIDVLVIGPKAKKQAVHLEARRRYNNMKPHGLLPIDRYLDTLKIIQKEDMHLGYSWQRLFTRVIDVDWVRALDNKPELAEQLEAFVSIFGRMQDTIADKLLPVGYKQKEQVVRLKY
jgi:hypothetical protein